MLSVNFNVLLDISLTYFVAIKLCSTYKSYINNTMFIVFGDCSFDSFECLFGMNRGTYYLWILFIVHSMYSPQYSDVVWVASLLL